MGSDPTAITSKRQGVAEIAAVLLVIQASFFVIAGLSALPFGIVEPAMRAEALATLMLAAGVFLLARGVARYRRWARTWTLVIEVLTVIGNLLLMLLPIGTLRGPVPLLTNLIMPFAIFLLLRSRSCRGEFRSVAPSNS